MNRLEKQEEKFVKAHQAEIDTLIDKINASSNKRTTGVRVWHLMVFCFRLGREYEREEG